MARMIPSYISSEVKSNAERRLFGIFRDDPNTKDWIVLHSLGLAEHERLVYGELDFVVLAPKLGIFCLEVKGGRVARNEGVWEFTDRYGKTNKKNRSPFEQASEGMFSLRKAILKHFPKYSNIGHLIFGHGVIFSDIDFDIISTEYDLQQVCNNRDLLNGEICHYIKRLSRFTVEAWDSTYHNFSSDMLPTPAQAREVASFLRGDFDKPVSLVGKIDSVENEIVRLTEEQLRSLDMYEDNKRILVKGAAGTGKTLLAIELAHRSISSNERVALLCYNSNLANWIKGFFDPDELEGNFIGTFHSLMLQMAAQHIVSLDDKDNDYFKTELPERIIREQLTPHVLFDRLIIDEAQDLITEEYVLIMDQILYDGIDRGKWDMFGDFSNQAIYSSQSSEADIVGIIETSATYALAKLSINCRNSKKIGTEIQVLTGLKSKYLPTTVEGIAVQYRTWASISEEVELLTAIIQELRDGHVSLSDITILSPRRFEDSVASLLDQSLNVISTSAENDSIRFSTIHSFKGLESSVVVLVDIETYGQTDLIYVATSRARASLYVAESKAARKERETLLKEFVYAGL